MINEGLKREIGVFGLATNSINTIVGAGIFVLPAVVAARLGTAGILAYLFCGVLLSLIMLCYAEVGSKVTCTGGSYAYIESAFGKYAGFLTANIFVIGASIAADAAVANALADTIAFAFPVFKQNFVRILFFLMVFSGLVTLNIRGVKQGIGLVKFSTVAKLLPLLFIITLGFTRVSFSNLEWKSIPLANDIGKMCLLLFFAFIGGETGLNVSGEIKKPGKTIPLGIFIAVITVLVIYISLHIVAQGMLGASLTKYSNAPLAEVARELIGPFGITLMLLGAGISMFGYLSGEVLNMPRIVFGAARDNVIPIKSLSKVHPKFATPYIAIIVYSCLSFTLSVIGEFQQLAILASASMLLIYLGVAAATIKIRLTGKNIPGSFNIPGGYIVPVLSIGAIVWFLSNLSGKEKIGMLIFVAILSAIYLAIYLIKKKNTSA
ncbi:MAG: amino acid permease [Ginsengibacter sp.]